PCGPPSQQPAQAALSSSRPSPYPTAIPRCRTQSFASGERRARYGSTTRPCVLCICSSCRAVTIIFPSRSSSQVTRAFCPRGTCTWASRPSISVHNRRHEPPHGALGVGDDLPHPAAVAVDHHGLSHTAAVGVDGDHRIGLGLPLVV